MTTSDLATSQADGFDIDSIEDLFEAEFEVLHPVTNAGLGGFVTIAGPEHPDRKRITHNIIRKYRAERAMAAADPQGQASVVTDPEEDEQESIERLANVVLAWRGFKKDGQPLACTLENKLTYFRDPKRQWLVRQLIRRMAGVEGFIKA